jgi:hypothetical protein
MENPDLISIRVAEWNIKANTLADQKYSNLMKIVGLDK